MTSDVAIAERPRDERDGVIDVLLDSLATLRTARAASLEIIVHLAVENFQLRVVADRWFLERLAAEQDSDRRRTRVAQLLEDLRAARAELSALRLQARTNAGQAA